MITASKYVRERRHAETTPGEALKIVRALQGLSQSELARRSRVKQSAISAIERGEMGLGIERAKALARALQVHPAVLAFPGWREPVDALESRPETPRTGNYVVSPKTEYLRVQDSVLPKGPVDAHTFVRDSVAADLRAARQHAKLTQTKLAKRIGKSQTLVSQAEAGVARVSERYVRAVLKACGLSPNGSGPAKKAPGGRLERSGGERVKTQKTPRSALEIARSRAKEVT